MRKKRFFSGIQPTGEIHIGNYLGAIKNWLNLLESGEYEGIISIVDYHAITMPYEKKEMQDRIRKCAATLMACGVNPDNSLLFVQSQVPQHTELSWILTCSSNMGELERMTQYKDKSKGSESIGVGLFSYPILQTADIVLYKAPFVPVGEDQIQHLELAREIVRRFNKRFGKVFPEPKPILGEAKRIMGLDGGSKMSKSLGNSISLTDSGKPLWKKLASAKTDEKRKLRTDPGVPEDCNVYNSYHLYFSSSEDHNKIQEGCTSASMGCVDCKKILLANMEKSLGPIAERYQELMETPQQIDDFLQKSAIKCREIAEETMQEVRQKMGLR